MFPTSRNHPKEYTSSSRSIIQVEEHREDSFPASEHLSLHTCALAHCECASLFIVSPTIAHSRQPFIQLSAAHFEEQRSSTFNKVTCEASDVARGVEAPDTRSGTRFELVRHGRLAERTSSSQCHRRTLNPKLQSNRRYIKGSISFLFLE